MRTSSDTPLTTRDPSSGETLDRSAGRVYRGRSVDELIPRIEADLGPDAIVVRRRTGLTGGIAGFFQRPFVEIEARPGRPGIDVYDEQPLASAAPPTLESLATEAHPVTRQPAARHPAARTAIGTYVTGELAALAAVGSREPDTADAGRAADSFTAALLSAETAAARALPSRSAPGSYAANAQAHTVVSETAGTAFPAQPPAPPARSPAPPAGPPAPPARPPVPPARPPTMTHAPQTLEVKPARSQPASTSAEPAGSALISRDPAGASIERSLLGLGVSEQFARELIDGAAAHVVPLAPSIDLAHAVRKALEQRIPVCPPLAAGGAALALVGPGGSGKTVCCVALLNAYRRSGTLPCNYATVIADPEEGALEVLLSPQILTPIPVTAPRAVRALANARDGGVAIIDTPPLSPADRPAISALAEMLGELEPDRVVLALPATIGAKAASQLLHALRPLGTDSLAITHADETDQIGVAVEAACRFGLAPEYLFDRARSRTGLIRVDPSYLADRLMP